MIEAKCLLVGHATQQLQCYKRIRWKFLGALFRHQSQAGRMHFRRLRLHSFPCFETSAENHSASQNVRLRLYIQLWGSKA